MKTNIATDSSQSQRLLRCGVSADTADMMWSRLDEARDHNLYAVPWYTPRLPNRKITDNDFPAWSLSALLGLLPTAILSPMGNKYMLELSSLRMHDAWEVQWFNGREKFRTYDKQKVFHKLWDKSPIEACVKAIEWLTSNGYKLNEQ